jgi:hypothetical protein
MTPEPRHNDPSMTSEAQHELTSDLDEWRVTLTTGDVVVFHAHSVQETEGYLVFLALMRGSPNYEYEVARVPAGVVAEWSGG